MSILYSRPAGQAAPSGTSVHCFVALKTSPMACSRGRSSAAAMARASIGPRRQQAKNASQPKQAPATSAPPLISTNVVSNSPRPEPASKASWMASNLLSRAPPPSSVFETGNPTKSLTGGCFLNATSMSRRETSVFPSRTKTSKSFRAAFSLRCAMGKPPIATPHLGSITLAVATGGAFTSGPTIAATFASLVEGSSRRPPDGNCATASTSREPLSRFLTASFRFFARNSCLDNSFSLRAWSFCNLFNRAFSFSLSIASLAFCCPLFWSVADGDEVTRGGLPPRSNKGALGGERQARASPPQPRCGDRP
mmetsp:Transcript_101456/g.286199  ORF Transcript_101456/g.286199 Transcript_101456/m.286199 type:complete len:309 (+) Transcript_101456:145-1071(+)